MADENIDEQNMNNLALSPEQLAAITNAVTSSLTQTIETRFEELQEKFNRDVNAMMKDVFV